MDGMYLFFAASVFEKFFWVLVVVLRRGMVRRGYDGERSVDGYCANMLAVGLHRVELKTLGFGIADFQRSKA
jgi:hypothetical protein